MRTTGNDIHINPLAIVTGASRGIGEAIARALAGRGYDLILTCRNNTARLTELKNELEAQVSVQALQCDVSDPEAVRSLFNGLTHLELLVNNAGTAYYGLLQDMSDREWRNIIDTDLSGPFYMCRQAIPLMLKGPAEGTGSDCCRIINIASVWVTTGAAFEAAYSAAKGGLNALTKALGRELAPSGIPVNALAPGVVDTDMLSVFNEEEKEAIKQDIPADRFLSTAEAAKALLSLLDMPSYFTGQIVTLDGGYT